jgi:hypothetical protein
MISKSRLLNVFMLLYERCNGDAFKYIVSLPVYPMSATIIVDIGLRVFIYIHGNTYSISSFEVETRQPSTYRADMITIKLLADKATFWGLASELP